MQFGFGERRLSYRLRYVCYSTVMMLDENGRWIWGSELYKRPHREEAVVFAVQYLKLYILSLLLLL